MSTEQEPIDAVSLQDFLESVPPGRTVRLTETSVESKYSPGTSTWYLALKIPQVSLYCSNAACDRTQRFLPDKTELNHPTDFFVRYTCRNCGLSVRTFAIRYWNAGSGNDTKQLHVFKFGEIPQFGPPLPAKLLQLAGGYGDLLKKGRRSENQSLGIGAFAYYRRVVEAQKSRLIDELRNAIQRLGGNPQALETLEMARAETQFSKALEQMADVTPKELFVSGHNPLRLLHGPLSIGLHGLTDEECLKKAHSVRVVMGALLERIQMITEEKAELDASIKDLLPPAPQNSPPPSAQAKK